MKEGVVRLRKRLCARAAHAVVAGRWLLPSQACPDVAEAIRVADPTLWW